MDAEDVVARSAGLQAPRARQIAAEHAADRRPCPRARRAAGRSPSARRQHLVAFAASASRSRRAASRRARQHQLLRLVERDARQTRSEACARLQPAADAALGAGAEDLERRFPAAPSAGSRDSPIAGATSVMRHRRSEVCADVAPLRPRRTSPRHMRGRSAADRRLRPTGHVGLTRRWIVISRHAGEMSGRTEGGKNASANLMRRPLKPRHVRERQLAAMHVHAAQLGAAAQRREHLAGIEQDARDRRRI